MIKKSTKPAVLQKVITVSDDDDLSSWQYPFVENDQKEDDQKTNALGQKVNWQYEPPEEVTEQEVVPLTAEDIEAIRQAAYEEGFTQGKEEGFTEGFKDGQSKGFDQGKVEGHSEGKAAGFAEGEQDVEELTNKWKVLIEQLNKPLAIVNEQIHKELIQLVCSLTEAVVYHEASINPDILLTAISEGVKALPGQKTHCQIHLHPDDIVIVENTFTEKQREELQWHLTPDASLEPGSCQIENSTSHADLTLKTRLKEVLEPFMQDAKRQVKSKKSHDA